MRTGVRLLAFLSLALAAIYCALLATASPAAAQQRRFAFVIGNGGYQNVPRLPNALNDASATAAVLREASFEVVQATDATLGGMRESLAGFIGKVERAGSGATALVYYAGHAIQLDGANYLLPVDIRPESSANIAGQSLSLSDILKRLDATGAVAKIAILDACRDNPFAARDFARGLALQMVDGATEAPRSEAGLARIDSRSGTFVAFATSPGATAADGAGANSPFTEAFLRLAREPGVPVEQLFRRIRLAVHDATNGTQIPWDTSSLITDFAFFQRPAAPAAPAAAAAADPVSLTARPTAASLRSLAAADAYRAAIAWDRRDVYRSVLEIHPEGERAPRLHRIVTLRTEETAWAETVRAGDAESLLMFARLFPGSQHVGEAVRMARTAPSRNQVRTVAATCPVCPAVTPPRSRRADFTPRPAAPYQPGAVAPADVAPVRTRPALAAPGAVVDASAQPAPFIAPLPVADAPRWSGFYVGALAGSADQSSRTRLGGFGPTDSVATSIEAGNVPAILNPNGRRASFGALAGFNFQTGPLVFGVEGDFSAMHVGGRQIVSVNPFGVQVTTRAENELFAMGTVRGRVGVALGDFLLYGTGGYAYGRANQSGSINPDPVANPTYVASNTQMVGGWTAGAGVEYALNRLIGLAAGPRIALRLDYLHYDLGARNLILGETLGLAPGEYATMRARTKGDLVRAGISVGF